MTEDAQAGGVEEEVMEDQLGAPERESEVMCQEREAAARQMREPVGTEVNVELRSHGGHPRARLKGRGGGKLA